MSWQIATWNVNSIKTRHAQVLQWLVENPVDILALQELKTLEFAASDFAKLGYHIEYVGQKAYNGVAILSKVAPIKRPIKFLVHAPENQARFLVCELPTVTIICVYVPNGSKITSDKYHYKLAWLDALEAWLSARLAQAQKNLVILGDYNIAPEIADTYDPMVWEGKVLASVPERTRYQNLLALGLVDAYSYAASASTAINLSGPRFTWWDYRAGAFAKNNGCRIDLILANTGLIETMESFVVDASPRALVQPSDHCPVVATFSGALA